MILLKYVLHVFFSFNLFYAKGEFLCGSNTGTQGQLAGFEQLRIPYINFQLIIIGMTIPITSS